MTALETELQKPVEATQAIKTQEHIEREAPARVNSPLEVETHHGANDTEEKTESGSTITPEVPIVVDAESAAQIEQTKEDGVIPVEKPALGTITAKLAAELAFDPAALKERYLQERDKRLRPDGNEQYKQFKGEFAHYLNDPYTPRVERDPIDVETDFLVLGGGFGGLCLGAELEKAGVKDFKIIDKAGDFGGTWYWNRYPGAACDIEAYIYMPLLEETNYIPTEKYAKAPELLEHSRRIGLTFDLYSRAIFHTEVSKMTWDESAERWIVETDRGDKIRARFAASASGPLNMPKLPGVEGIRDFKGHSFHTSRFDYAYTGGTLHGKLDKLGDKRVGFIGTGATAIQAVPHLGEGAQQGELGRLYVFQRTPSSVSWRNNRKTDPEWVSSLKAGWQADRSDNFLRVLGGAQEDDLVSDGWTSFSRWLREKEIPRSPSLWVEYGSLLELADMQNMERIRARCDEVVKDKATAAALKPWYRQFCKRPCFHDEYLDTYNLPNVALVDTNGKGIDRITEKGIVANGKEYELDCIIYGTGFEVGQSYARRSNYEAYGRNGRSMTDKWSEGVRTLHGFWMRDFPNLFIITTLQSGFAANFVHMLSRQATHIAWTVRQCLDRGIRTIEPTQEAEDAWVDGIVQHQRRMGSYQKECTPGYYNREGQISDSIVWQRSSSYGLGAIAFCKIMEDWRTRGDFEGLECVYDEKTQAATERAVLDSDPKSLENGHANGSTIVETNEVPVDAPKTEAPMTEPVNAPKTKFADVAKTELVTNGVNEHAEPNTNGTHKHPPPPVVEDANEETNGVVS